MTELRNSLFGRLVLQTGLVTKDQIVECLKLQKQYEEQGKKVPRLGELMAKQGYLTVGQVKKLLKQQREQAAKGADEGKKAADASASKSAPAPQAEGELTNGDSFGVYEVLHRLGTDSKGSTYKAQHTEDDTLVTLRVLSENTMGDADYIKRFSSLAKKASKLKHENIQRILSAGTAKKKHFYAAEFMEGVSLRRLLESRGKIEPRMALSILRDVCSALEYGHARGMFHQELTPANIILRADKTAVVSGFGAVPEPVRNLEQLVKNTGDVPFYVAPEQASDDEEAIDARTDLYSLGAILYHLLSGQPPFHGHSVEEVLLQIAEEDLIPVTLVADSIPESLSDLTQKLLALDPEDRYLSATEVLEALKTIEKELEFEGDTVHMGPDEIKKAGAVGTGMKSTGARAAVSSAAAKRSKSGVATARSGTRHRGEKPGGVHSRMRKHAKEDQKANTVVYAIVALLALVGIVCFAVFVPAYLEKEDAEKRRLAELEDKAFEAEQQKRREKAAKEAKAKQEAVDRKVAERKKKREAEKAAKRAASRKAAQEQAVTLSAPVSASKTPTAVDTTPATVEERLESERKAEMKNRLQAIDLNKDPDE
ncbi:MAG: serine/threonine protein kinase [Planctomycetota bacterium]|jgi:serine/threonine protein kinase